MLATKDCSFGFVENEEQQPRRVHKISQVPKVILMPLYVTSFVGDDKESQLCRLIYFKLKEEKHRM